jgi:SAM-dependent methyltransferase
VTGPDGSEFDAIADDYERVRPAYPDALVDAAVARGRLDPGSRVLEIGCGTGQLTAALVERDLVVDAVDPGARLLERARRHVGEDRVQFHLARFEDVELPVDDYAAAFSATAFHWIDPDVGWSKLARVLRPGGVLALFQGSLGGAVTELDEEISASWLAVSAAAASWRLRGPFELWQGADGRLGNVSELWAWLTQHDLGRPEAAELFAGVQILTVPLAEEFTTDSYIVLLRTTSSYLRLPEPAQQELEARIRDAFTRAGGVMCSARLATLVTAQRRVESRS